MATLYLDPDGGNDANNGQSFANRKKSITSVSSVASAGDNIRIMRSPHPVSLGNGTWTDLSGTVTLASAVTKNIYTAGTWTSGAGSNVVCSAPTVRKLGATASLSTFATGFTTGLASYYATGTLNLSSYNQISFWFKSNTAIADASIFQVKLCSDTGGTTAVDTFTLPAIPLVANIWLPITIDKGSALGSAIASVALYTTSDPATPAIAIDNVFAHNGFSLATLIGKDGDTGTWWGIRSIDETDVILDIGANSSVTSPPKGYVGTSGTATTYYRVPTNMVAVNSATADIGTIGTSGSSGNPITWSGGWNTTDMTTQDGETWLSGRNCSGEMFALASRQYNDFEDIGVCFTDKAFLESGSSGNNNYTRCASVMSTAVAFSIAGTTPNNIFTDCFAIASGGVAFSYGNSRGIRMVRSHALSCTTNGVSTATVAGTYFEDCSFSACGSNAMNLNTTANCYLIGCTTKGNTGAGVLLTNASRNTFINHTSSNNSTMGVNIDGSGNNKFINLVTEGNTQASLDWINNGSDDNYFYNWSYNESTQVLSPIDYADGSFISIKDDGGSGTVIYTDGGRISTNTSVRHTASGVSWALQPTASTRDVIYPLVHNIGAILVEENIQVTASVWLRRTNTGIDGGFRIKGYQIAGVNSDVTDTISVGADTWEQVSIQFTPTETGVVELEVYAYGGTTYTLYWDDLEVDQATSLNGSSGDYSWLKTGVLITEDNVTGGGGGATSYASVS
jgi:hypothetical protein